MGKYRIYYGIVLLATILLFLWTNTAQVLLALCLLVLCSLAGGDAAHGKSARGGGNGAAAPDGS